MLASRDSVLSEPRQSSNPDSLVAVSDGDGAILRMNLVRKTKSVSDFQAKVVVLWYFEGLVSYGIRQES